MKIIADGAGKLAKAKDARKAELAAYRFERETAGYTLNGITVHTDRESRGNLTGASLGAVLDPEMTTPWKAMDGSFVVLTGPEIISLAQATMAYVQACFSREAEIAALIDAADTPAAIAAIDITEGWPEQ